MPAGQRTTRECADARRPSVVAFIENPRTLLEALTIELGARHLAPAEPAVGAPPERAVIADGVRERAIGRSPRNRTEHHVRMERDSPAAAAVARAGDAPARREDTIVGAGSKRHDH